jgi:hypothetical protein
MKNRFVRIAISLATGVVLLLLQAAPSVAAVGVDPLNLGPGTHRYNLSGDELTPLFTDRSYVRVHGTRNADGGCSFPSSLRRAPGERAKGEVTAALNQSLCLEVVLAGHLSKAPRHGTKSLTPPAPLVGTSCHYGADDYWQTDPINIVVNDVTTLISACYANNMILTCSGNNDFSYYTPTHWYKISGPSTTAYQSPALVNCYASTYFLVGNDWFRCPQQAHVRTYYAYNSEGVNYNGYFWDNSSVSTSGACSFLLTWHHTLY